MLTVSGDIWDLQAKEPGSWVGVTTNGVVKANGELVMGRGIALEAAKRFPQLPYQLGLYVSESGNIPKFLPDIRIVSIPTKHDWQDKSDLALIEVSIRFIHAAFKNLRVFKPEAWSNIVFIPPPGCGNGGLTIDQVQPILDKYLDDQFVLVKN